MTSTSVGDDDDTPDEPLTRMSLRSSVETEQFATASVREDTLPMTAAAAGAPPLSTPARHTNPSTDISVRSGAASDDVREPYKPASTHGHE